MWTMIKWVPIHLKYLTGINSFSTPLSQGGLILSPFYKKDPIAKKWLEPEIRHEVV